jgi:transposase
VDVEIVARVERRRKWTPEEKAAVLAEVEAEGGGVTVVARRHRISASLLYNWRSAWKAAAAAARTPATLGLRPLGVFAGAGGERPAMLAAPTRRSQYGGSETSSTPPNQRGASHRAPRPQSAIPHGDAVTRGSSLSPNPAIHR